MFCTLAAPRVEAVLSGLYAAASHDFRHSSPSARGRAMASAADRAGAFQDVSFPVSAEAGKLLYALVRASRPGTVVEFGTSFGVSTIYLAAAVADNGSGHVVTTELSSKAAYLRYVRGPASGYVTVAFPLGDGLEISTWTGR
jgi:predicted O-methyltransferase YrrM